MSFSFLFMGIIMNLLGIIFYLTIFSDNSIMDQLYIIGLTSFFACFFYALFAAASNNRKEISMSGPSHPSVVGIIP